ncbi:hypothetical protein TCAP_00995 [Tolypocladium capitatum]|uniref:Extracellular membrane protein CFEM domain-containing protein n=1 Tax=Tolypocladium capitatum TaxID=45235 RepID=A0A2K3QNH4_9HYPO|nr:hypothetical protein TCAP_00995 [Tolypocladium capitatum]
MKFAGLLVGLFAATIAASRCSDDCVRENPDYSGFRKCVVSQCASSSGPTSAPPGTTSAPPGSSSGNTSDPPPAQST